MDAAHAPFVDTVEALEELYGRPQPHALGKESPVLHEAYRRLVEASPFAILASVGPEGVDASPRGDAPGFARVLDERTLALPDRRGNRRLDTLRNVVRDPRVSLLFLVPGVEETLRVVGRARISVSPELLASFEVDGAAPASVLVLEVETVYFQCARALKRSRLWSDDARVDRRSLPSAGEMSRASMPDFDAETYDAELDERQRRTLY